MDDDRQTILPKNTQAITTRPGVYLYYDAAGKVIYVGKAKNLKNRVRAYFTRDDALGVKTPLLVSEIASVKTIPTDSEFDAILLEASLIRKHQPKWNSASRDDKSPLYVVITFDESLPRILFTRKRALEQQGKQAVFGPFQSGRIARKLMQSIRRIIPYCTQKTRDGAPCFYTHIGLCNPCPSAMLPSSPRQRVYRQNLRRIALLLSGRGRRVRSELEKSMQEAAKHEAFEEAGEYKRQLTALDMLLIRSYDPGIYTDRTEDRIADLAKVLCCHVLIRIECIDISHIHGKWATGSLVVFTNGIPDTDEYRRFRITIGGRPNDVGMMAEVMRRRFAHPEWPYPNLLVVDGGKPQVNAAIQAKQATHAGQAIPVIGLAKRFEEIIVPTVDGFRVIRLSPGSPALQLVEHIRDEAHRFAKRYHTMLRSRYV